MPILARHLLSAALLSAAALALPASAQTATRIRGTIDTVEPGRITVKAREGGEVAIKLPDPPRVSVVVRKSLADITAGSFVGVTGMPMPDGAQRAVAIAILPEAARANSFHAAWDLLPESTMTNAAVTETVKGVQGETLKLTYKDGEKLILVSPETPIVAPVPASVADLKPGVKVVVFATKGPDGSLTAGNVLAGRDGVDPPM